MVVLSMIIAERDKNDKLVLDVMRETKAIAK